MKTLQVAVGVLINARKQVLIGQRTVKDRYYQKWEFPGGKLEPGEQPSDALTRELAEELGITVHTAEPLIELRHQYPDRDVHLFVFRVTEYSGTPQGQERQALQWTSVAELENIDFLSGNTKIVEALQAFLKA